MGNWYKTIYPELTELSDSEARSYTLGQARGKILINYHSVIPKTEQDWYDVNTCGKRKQKWTKISDTIDLARSSPTEQKLFVNFLSGTGGANAFNIFSGCHPSLFVKGIAEYMNDRASTK